MRNLQGRVLHRASSWPPRLIREFTLLRASPTSRTDSKLDQWTAIHDDEGYRDIRRLLATQYNREQPGARHPGGCATTAISDRSLVLRHQQTRGRPLAAEDANQVMKHLGRRCGLPGEAGGDHAVTGWRCRISRWISEVARPAAQPGDPGQRCLVRADQRQLAVLVNGRRVGAGDAARQSGSRRSAAPPTGCPAAGCARSCRPGSPRTARRSSVHMAPKIAPPRVLQACPAPSCRGPTALSTASSPGRTGRRTLAGRPRPGRRPAGICVRW